ncbi:MAG: hypothetical protein ACK2TU_08750, partial [Anaerolineales bacterium]
MTGKILMYMDKLDYANTKATLEHPYTIHCCPLSDPDSPYPTHTHGLHDIGWPEFIMDPCAFGGEGNGKRINSA